MTHWLAQCCDQAKNKIAQWLNRDCSLAELCSGYHEYSQCKYWRCWLTSYFTSAVWLQRTIRTSYGWTCPPYTCWLSGCHIDRFKQRESQHLRVITPCDLWPFFTSVETAGIHWLADAVYAAFCIVPTNAISRSNCTAIWYVVCLRSGLDGPPQLYSWNGSCINHNLLTAKLMAFPLSY